MATEPWAAQSDSHRERFSFEEDPRVVKVCNALIVAIVVLPFVLALVAFIKRMI